jgi:hypothetical protein
MWAKVILLLTFSISASFGGELKIAILDTYFCPKLLKTSKNIQIKPVIDNTSSHNPKSCNKFSKKNRLFHGQLVLKNFIENLNSKEKISIQPISIFNSQGFQDIHSWKEAFKDQTQYDLYIIAAGLNPKKKVIEFPKITTPLIIAGATFGRGINKSTRLWPQAEYNKDLVITIGTFLEQNEDLGTRDDYNLIFKDRMKYFFSAGKDDSDFRGSSYAVSVAASRLVSLCFLQIKKEKGPYKCLEANKKFITLKESKKELPTF